MKMHMTFMVGTVGAWARPLVSWASDPFPRFWVLDANSLQLPSFLENNLSWEVAPAPPQGGQP